MARAGWPPAKIKKNVNGFALELGQALDISQGAGRLSRPPAKIKKRERFWHLYSKISFGLGRLGQSGSQAGLAGLVNAFRALSWPAGPDPGTKPFPFLFF